MFINCERLCGALVRRASAYDAPSLKPPRGSGGAEASYWRAVRHATAFSCSAFFFFKFFYNKKKIWVEQIFQNNFV